MSRLAKEYGIPRSSLQTILRNRDKVIAEFEAGRNVDIKRMRKHNFDNVDEPLLKWFLNEKDKNIPISGEMLLSKAQEFARECGYENAQKLDINWVNRWKAREEIVCRKIHGEAESFSQHGVCKWKNNRLSADVKEIENTGVGDGEIWDKLQACGLAPEMCAFMKYSEVDTMNIVTNETVTTDDTLHNLESEVEGVQEDGDDDSIDAAEALVTPVEALVTPVEALTSLRQIDRYLRSHDDSEEMLDFLAKIEHYIIHKSISRQKQSKTSFS